MFVWWKSFTVDEKAVTLSADFLKNVKRQLNVNAKVFNASTGKEITALSKCYVNFKNNWIELSEFQVERLLSGNVWKFRFSAEGYTDEIYSLRLDWLQDELYIFANLTPIEEK